MHPWTGPDGRAHTLSRPLRRIGCPAEPRRGRSRTSGRCSMATATRSSTSLFPVVAVSSVVVVLPQYRRISGRQNQTIRKTHVVVISVGPGVPEFRGWNESRPVARWRPLCRSPKVTTYVQKSRSHKNSLSPRSVVYPRRPSAQRALLPNCQPLRSQVRDAGPRGRLCKQKPHGLGSGLINQSPGWTHYSGPMSMPFSASHSNNQGRRRAAPDGPSPVTGPRQRGSQMPNTDKNGRKTHET